MLKNTQIAKPETFDTSKMLFSKPEILNIPNSILSYKRIKVNYQHNEDEISDLILESPNELLSWGLTESRDMQTGSLSGYQLPIVLWNKDGPTKEQERFTNVIEQIAHKCKEHLVENRADIEKYDLEMSDLKKSMDPLFWKRDKGKILREKGPTLYGKVIYNKKMETISTRFLNLSINEEVDPMSTLHKHLYCKFSLKLESIFIGHVISIQFKLHEVGFKLKNDPNTSLSSLLFPDIKLNKDGPRKDVLNLVDDLHKETTSKNDTEHEEAIEDESEEEEEVEEIEEEEIEEEVVITKEEPPLPLKVEEIVPTPVLKTSGGRQRRTVKTKA